MKVESKQKLLSDPSAASSYSQRKEHKTLVKNTLYIANLPTNVTEDDIFQLFKPYNPKNVNDKIPYLFFICLNLFKNLRVKNIITPSQIASYI